MSNFLERFTSLPEHEVIEILLDADDRYGSPDQSELAFTDQEYDILRTYAEEMFPTNPYFIRTGSEVRGAKIKLPVKMTGLTQIQIGDADNWIFGYKDEDFVIIEKLDGGSAGIMYDQAGNLKVAFTRGDGEEGSDVTRHFRKMRIPGKIGGNLTNQVIRGEVIIRKADFDVVKKICQEHTGREYKALRNMACGLMNNETIPDQIYQYLRFIAYDIMGSDLDKVSMLEALEEAGFETPEFRIWSALERPWIEEDLVTALNEMRDESFYEIDGVVIEVNGPSNRDKFDTNDKPRFAMKFKVADASNLADTEVIGVVWKRSKHSYLKPTVLVKPVNLAGATIQRATGFNAKFIRDHMIGPGAVVRLTRSGDVIPYILSVVSPSATADLPNEPFLWNETGVDIVALNESPEVERARIKSFLNSIDAENVQDATIEKIWDAGYQSIEDVLIMTREIWRNVIGKNGEKAYDSIAIAMNPIALDLLMGAWPYFGRGWGTKKATKVVETLGWDALNATTEILAGVDNMGYKTAQMISIGLERFCEFMSFIEDNKIGTVELPKKEQKQSTGRKFAGQNVVFTGFRDNDLSDKIELNGGNMQDGVNQYTTILVAKDITKKSNKITKAIEQGVKVMSRDEMIALLAE